MRTTSSLEAFNGELGKLFQNHPNIWSFMDSLKLFEFQKSNILQQKSDENHVCFERRHQKDRKRDRDIKELTELLKKKRISPHQFLREIASRRMFRSKGVVQKISINLQHFIIQYIFSADSKKNRGLERRKLAGRVAKRQKRIK